jgi:threonine synthase
MFIPTSDLFDVQLKSLISKAYSSYDEDILKVKEVQGVMVAELFHGKTMSFKDLALGLVGEIVELMGSRRDKHYNVVVATSGDTGSAAMAALAGKNNADVYVLYPHEGISPIQELQMTSQSAPNLHCVAVRGSFDDCQSLVKSLFAAQSIPSLTAMNSINIARVLVQMVYYFYLYLKCTEKLEEVAFSVPTGNFGNVLAGWYAKKMGLPIVRLMVATNENDVLHTFFQTGVYKRLPSVIPTISPSMDIQVASNFERYLYYATESCETVTQLMEELKTTGQFAVSEEILRKCQADFMSASVSQELTKAKIREIYQSDGYILDPHSAIAFASAQFMTKPVISLATAHYGKFVEAVKEAIGEDVPVPESLAALGGKPQNRVVLPNRLEDVERFILGEKKSKRGGRWPLVTVGLVVLGVAWLAYRRWMRRSS